MAIDPGVVLIKQLRAVFPLSQEDLATSRMDLSILRNVIYSALVDSPTVVFRLVLCHLLLGVECLVGVFLYSLYLLSFLHELALALSVPHCHLGPLGHGSRLYEVSSVKHELVLGCVRQLVHVKCHDVVDFLHFSSVCLQSNNLY